MINEFVKKFRVYELKVIDFKHWQLSVRPRQVTLGSMVVSLKRECKSLGELSADESKELSLVFFKTESLLTKAFQFDKMNYLCLMMVDEQVHFHVIPRYSKPIRFLGNDYPDHSWPSPPNVTIAINDQTTTIKVYNTLIELYKERKPVVGYTTGVFDLFHIGHLNVLKKAKDNCDYLIVGVTTDELASKRKNKKPIICLNERVEILRSISVVDIVVVQDTMDKFVAWEKYNFHKMFVGSDWKGTEKWNKLESDFANYGVEIIYFPYTNTTSSTLIRKVLSTF